VRSLTFTFQRTANLAALGGSHSSDLQRKSTPRRPSKSFTVVKSVGVICGSTSRRTVRGPRVNAVISAALRPIVTAAATQVVAISIAVAATAVAAAETVDRTNGRRSPKAVAEGCAARSEACSDDPLAAFDASRAVRQLACRLKNLGRGVNPARVPVFVVPPRSMNPIHHVGGSRNSRRQSYGKAPKTRLSTSILGHICAKALGREVSAHIARFEGCGREPSGMVPTNARGTIELG